MGDEPLEVPERCQEYYPGLVCTSLPDSRKALFLRHPWWRLKKRLWRIQAMGLIPFLKRKLTPRIDSTLQRTIKSVDHKPSYGELHLQPGEWVDVRSEAEIFSTLDEHNTHRGLQFTREMRMHCGRRYRVLKRMNKIILEATGELRTFKVPTVILEGVFCDGSFHAGCDKTCFHFWREVWLKRVTENSPEKIKRDV